MNTPSAPIFLTKHHRLCKLSRLRLVPPKARERSERAQAREILSRRPRVHLLLVPCQSFLMPMELYETEAHQQRGDDKSDNDPRRQGSRFVLEMLIEHCDKYRLHSSQSKKNAHVEAVRYCRLEGCQVEFDVSPTH